MKALLALDPLIWKYRERLFLGAGLRGVHQHVCGLGALHDWGRCQRLERGQRPLPGAHGRGSVAHLDQLDLPAPWPSWPTPWVGLARAGRPHVAGGRLDFVLWVGALQAVFYLLAFLVKGGFSFLTRQTIIVMSRLVEYDLKRDIYGHYQVLDSSFYKRHDTGDLMNRISEDGHVRCTSAQPSCIP